MPICCVGVSCTHLSRLYVCKSISYGFASHAASTVTNHYQVLGLTPKATQGEIKASYYKLSKLYHPDVNTDDVMLVKNYPIYIKIKPSRLNNFTLQNEIAATKFRQITAAYEVLGNLKLRRMYDKGLLPRDGVTFHRTMTDTEDLKPEVKSPFKRTRTQPATGRTHIYDFDEWSRVHYGNALNRRNAAKEKKKDIEESSRDNLHTAQSHSLLYFAMIGLSLLVLLQMMGSPDHDNPTSKTKKPQPSTKV